MTRKLIVNDGRVERELLLVGKMVVGRDPFCDISDAGPLLSRRHAELVVSANDVQIRDLGSRNGILLNGNKVGQGTLQPGDVVQVGHLQLRYVLDRTPVAATKDVPDPDETEVIHRAPMPSPQPVAAPAPQPASAPALEASDKTVVITRPASRAPARPATAPAAPAPRPEAAATIPLGAIPAPGAAPDRATRVATRPRSPFVFISVMTLGAVVFLTTAIPLSIRQGKVLDATATARASTLVNWLAADAAAALQTGASVERAADALAREPGVVSAFILTPDGRVLAPGARVSETIGLLPGLGVKPFDVSGLQAAWNGDLVEAARPLETTGAARAAVAWITFRPPAPADVGSGAAVFALPAAIAIIAPWFVATLIGRRYARSASASAATGRID